MKEQSSTKPCPVCGQEIAKSAKTCPSCGAKNKKPIYKRAWFIVLVVIVVFAIIGSGTSGNKNNSTSDTAGAPTAGAAAPEVQKTPTVVAINDLFGALKANALNASNTYKDQYVEVTGVLTNVDSSGDYFSIGSTSDKYMFDSILCNIDDSLVNTVAAFKSNQQVTVIGTISDVGEIMGYTIEVESIK